MKQNDYLTIAVTVIISGVFSFIICSKFINTSKNKRQSVEIVNPISADFNLPDKKIFNGTAVDPTQLIQIGPNSNNQPFANK
jgi:hypothetical protein